MPDKDQRLNQLSCLHADSVISCDHHYLAVPAVTLDPRHQVVTIYGPFHQYCYTGTSKPSSPHAFLTSRTRPELQSDEQI